MVRRHLSFVSPRVVPWPSLRDSLEDPRAAAPTSALEQMPVSTNLGSGSILGGRSGRALIPEMLAVVDYFRYGRDNVTLILPRIVARPPIAPAFECRLLRGRAADAQP